MAWNDLIDVQAVTFTDIQTCPNIQLNSGQSPITSIQCMQKSDLLTMYNVDTTNPYLSPKPPNQIIVKQDVTPIISTFDCPVSTINRITFLGLDTQSYGGNNYYGISIFVNVGTVSGTVPIQFSVDNYYSSGYLQVIYGGIATHIQDVTSTTSTITANYTYTYNPSNGTVIEINFVPYT